MESLALFVAILLSIVVLTGPMSFLLTTRIVWDYSKRVNALWIIRRILVSILSPAGIAISAIFIFIEIPIGPKIVALAGIALNVFVLKREYFRDK